MGRGGIYDQVSKFLSFFIGGKGGMQEELRFQDRKKYPVFCHFGGK